MDDNIEPSTLAILTGVIILLVPGALLLVACWAIWDRWIRTKE
jgi:hypothetical protein